jgi:heavy metal translocating P-type ATPase
MTRRLGTNYLFLAAAGVPLIVGLTAQSLSQATLSTTAFAVGAAIGLVLSIGLLVEAIRSRTVGSDVLAVISIVVTALASEWLAASVIAVMLSTGRALESWAAGRARNELAALLARAPKSAHRISSTGEITIVPLNLVAVGDRILVRNGEVVPIDGRLMSHASLDESALTGEPMPKARSAGDEVNSGVLNAGGEIEIIAGNTAEDSTYAHLIRLVEQAQAGSAAGVRVANKWAVRFVPFALGLAGLTWLISGEVTNAVAVIVAATPCPLILAVPAAIIAGMSKSATKGVIVKGGGALERLASAKTVLLDKTGTLTHGGPRISTISFSPGVDSERVIRLAASLEQSSPHVVAKALVFEARERDLQLSRATRVVEIHGSGLSGTVDGSEIYVGQPQGVLPEWADASSALLVAVHVDEELAAVVGLDDPLRADAVQTLKSLRELGITRIAMLSGDRKSTAEALAKRLSMDAVFAECKPSDKLEILRAEMETTPGAVIVVGDGINDAPALAAADVGVAMGARGATAASEAADVVILEDSIGHLASAIEIAQGALRRAMQAAMVGMGLATVAMFLAAFGLISPTASAVIQEFIDAAAILWALVPVKSRKTN